MILSNNSTVESNTSQINTNHNSGSTTRNHRRIVQIDGARVVMSRGARNARRYRQRRQIRQVQTLRQIEHSTIKNEELKMQIKDLEIIENKLKEHLESLNANKSN